MKSRRAERARPKKERWMNARHVKHAAPGHPVLDAIAQRWSPYVYDGRPVEQAKLLSCLEAARWAASSFNEQPWSFIVARREDKPAFDAALSCLMEANQVWARDAGVLMLTVVSRFFTRNNTANRVAEHDLGMAAGNLSLQATALGLQAHHMAGVNLARIRQLYEIPEGQDPYTAIALGYAADAATSAAPLADRDKGARARKELSQFVFKDKWKKPAL
jgi:nitroreductase